MTVQAGQLRNVVAAETERIRTDLAKDRADLRLSGCGIQLVDDVGNRAYGVCRLSRHLSGGAAPIEQALTPDNILMLETALAEYGKNLALLASDSSQDQASFSAAVTVLGASLGKLDGAIAKATAGPRIGTDAKLGAVASIIARLGNLIFAYQRQAALKRIIVESDAFVAEAGALLEQADEQILLYDVGAAYREATAAEVKATSIANNATASVADIRAAHNTLYAAIDWLNAVTARKQQISNLVQVHHALAVAARSGASRSNLEEAMRKLIEWNAKFS
jgi:hypothetical protein